MESSDLLTEFRNIAPRVVPELSAVPFYALMHPPALPTPIETAAYAVVGRHILLRDHLHSTGEWRGWGPAIVFIDVPTDRIEFLGLALHELAHPLPLKRMADVEPTTEDRERQEAKVLAWAAADPMPRKQPEPWAGHAMQFVRRLLHLHYRALWLGIPIPINALSCAGSHYGLSPVWRYLSALGSEPFDLAERSFAEIESTPAPAAFVNLFVGDVAAWHRGQLLDLEQPCQSKK